MAIPYLLGLAAGSVAVFSLKLFKAKQRTLPADDSFQDLPQESTDDEMPSSDSPSTKTTSTKKKA
jgi:hypothetical protein